MDNKILFLLNTIQCTQKLYYGSYSAAGLLLESNTDDPMYDAILRQSGFPDIIYTSGDCESSLPESPLLLINEGELMWSILKLPAIDLRSDSADDSADAFSDCSAADFQAASCKGQEKPHSGTLLVLGPFFPAVFSLTDLQRIVEIPQVKNKWKDRLIAALRKVPVITVTDLIRLTIQLFYAASGKKLSESGIRILQAPTRLIHESHLPEEYDCWEGWIRDNNLCEIIRNGDRDYQRMLPPDSDSLAALVQLMYPANGRSQDQLRQQISIEAGLCIRAAIDGGLTPSAAYQRGSLYLTGIRSAASYEELLSLLLLLCEDLIFQVHAKKQQPKYSDLINRCIDYMNDHAEEPLNIEILAEHMNYSKYYLSKRFKTETGDSINSFLKTLRIRKAGYMLVTTSMNIQQISDRLHFGNRNFFTRVFKEETGMGPAEYRMLHTKRRPDN